MYSTMTTAMFLCFPGNGQCSSGKENPRMSVDMSAPNGQTVPQGPNSPSGECSVYIDMSLQSTKKKKKNALCAHAASPLDYTNIA